MQIDLEKLSEKELIELNNKIVARLRFLREMRTHSQMMAFSIGERVSFQPKDRERIFGTLTKYNRKTVTVITDDGEHWNVSPLLLSKVESQSENKGANIIALKSSRK
ncbi:MAG: hypothetical protein ACE5I1_26670 [bacterium]